MKTQSKMTQNFKTINKNSCFLFFTHKRMLVVAQAEKVHRNDMLASILPTVMSASKSSRTAHHQTRASYMHAHVVASY